MRSFLALITPMSDNYPDNSLPVPPPNWDTFPKPLPPGYGPGSPQHPIYNPGYPDQGLPGGGHYPSQGPGFPTHPIHIPELPVYPDQGLPGDQPVIDNSLPGTPVYPDNSLPAREQKFKKVVGWTPQTGWVVALVPVGEHPVPSK
jgi:hypothetical protein